MNVLTSPAVVIGVFVVATLWRLDAHEMWRDELHSWVLARDSASFAELAHNAEYEGHPLLWYALLWLVTRVARDLLVLQLVHATIAVSVAAVILFLAPFGRWVRIALVFGYFPFYEYAIIARPYSLTLLLVLVVCVLFRRRRRSVPAIATALGLLALTTAFGLLLSVALAAALGVDELLARRERGRPLRPGWRDLTASAVYVGAVAAAIVQITPPADAPFGAGLTTPDVAHDTWPFSVVASAILPVRKMAIGTWGATPWDEPYGVLAGVGLLVAIAWAVRRPAAVTCWVVGSGSIVAFTVFRIEGLARHHGHVFIAALAAFWICDAARPWPRAMVRRFRGDGRPWDLARAGAARLVPIGVTVVLAVQVVAGLTISVVDVRFQFSGAEAAANYLRDNGLTDHPILGDPDFLAFAVTARLDRGASVPGRPEEATFVRWDADRPQLDVAGFLAAARRLARGEDVVIVTRANGRLEGRPELRSLATFDESTVRTERLTLYLLPAEP